MNTPASFVSSINQNGGRDGLKAILLINHHCKLQFISLSDPAIFTVNNYEGSIPFTRSTSTPFIMNDLPFRWSCEVSESHNRFNGLLMDYELIQMGVKSSL